MLSSQSLGARNRVIILKNSLRVVVVEFNNKVIYLVSVVIKLILAEVDCSVIGSSTVIFEAGRSLWAFVV